MTALRPERKDSYGSAPHEPYGTSPYGAQDGTYGDELYGNERYGNGGHPAEPYPSTAYGPGADGAEAYGPEPHGAEADGADANGSAAYERYGSEAYEPSGVPFDDETVALRVAQPPGRGRERGPISASEGSSASGATGVTPGGRAARRKAAKRRRGGRHGSAATGQDAPQDGQGPAPRSRVEARRLARARKPSPGVIASRVIGELFITTGVLMLLFVTYQLWWTNVRAHAQAGQEANSLQQDWANGKRSPGVFEPGQGFAILHIPKLDVVVPIAEGVSTKRVLDKGMVGHYGEEPLKTAMPGDRTGNFGLAGHRNTHGEPFRYINRLQPGDEVVVETQDTYYVYKMTSTLPVTSPSNTKVLDPVPPGSGFTAPGRYITLTTCTPEFTSKYRLIVWGKMVEERPRSKGKPDALVS
ncbi:class E sortase [Streptomyces sp. NPDC028635]|uniref:class E sortase n=1 Tax=Streptomyces sp. NPDC028635 TaxID=3154800 RepID=UPI0033CEFECC